MHMIRHRFLGGSSIPSVALILQIMVPVLPQPCTRRITSQLTKLPVEQQVLAQTVCKFNVTVQNVMSNAWQPRSQCLSSCGGKKKDSGNEVETRG